MHRRHTIYLFTALICFLSILWSCKQSQLELPPEYVAISGKTMGTFYNIKLSTFESPLAIQKGIDSILNIFEDELSTYRPNSVISRFNDSPSGICVDTFTSFYKSFRSAKLLFELTDGYFDPTIGPLVNYWGFGADRQKKKSNRNQDTIQSILTYVGYNKLSIDFKGQQACLNKLYPEQKLDLNASAKGMGVDLVSNYLDKKGCKNYMVEVGGEVKTKGINDKGSVWVLGITKPSSNANLEDVILPVKLPNKAMATSGNYRQFYSNGELTFAHIINTKNGQSEPTDILSATVIAEDCETADAFATAFMALGKEKAIHLSEKVKFIETCFIYNDVNSDSLAYYFSPGFEIYRK